MTITIDSTWPQWILEVKLFPNFGFLLIFFRGPVEMCWAQFNGWSERRIVCKRFETKDRRISTGNPIRPTSGCVNFEAKETQFWTSQKRQFSSKALWSAMIVWGGTCLDHDVLHWTCHFGDGAYLWTEHYRPIPSPSRLASISSFQQRSSGDVLSRGAEVGKPADRSCPHSVAFPIHLNGVKNIFAKMI